MRTVKLVPFEEEDIPQLVSWIGTREELYLWSGNAFTFPVNERQFRAHLDSLQEDTNFAFKAVRAEDQSMVGYVELAKIQRGASANLRKLIVKPGNSRRAGYARSIVKQILEYGFTSYDLNRIYLGVFDTNAPAIKLYQQCGFIREGCWREHIKVDGKFLNLVWMGILCGEWSEKSGSAS